ncbi:MAG: hypothetical protein ACK4XJ_10050 [Fimbriimonadaceae bacterium]
MRVETRGEAFLFNGAPTWPGRPCEGLVFNSRMVQAIVDEEDPTVRASITYPDTGAWDPDRNTSEFCRALPEYRRYGLQGVTVGLQGGGSCYRSDLYDRSMATAFRPDGSLKPAWLDRLRRVLEATRQHDMMLILNLFYWRQERFESDAAVFRAIEGVMAFLCDHGPDHVLIDLKNEVNDGPGLLQRDRIHEALECARAARGAALHPLIGVSTFPKKHLLPEPCHDLVDVWLPHGNDSTSQQLAAEIEEVRSQPRHRERPRPILINEDSIHIDNLYAAVRHGASWGYYDQGFGSDGYHGRFDWRVRGREDRCETLSGFQTLPVNWSINTGHKRAFFDAVADLTGSG